ncbi:FAD-binding oxidoreductase [Agromyces marinus]|uniref:Oxidoreductase n=1 Tax=Agromyces marinus TaxID=1389020 RepID=A0ABN6YDV4_9MICO|nr:FAD-binding protein [Agromyces marinus]UIP59662.1 Mitomycin radical oxidase [Agromyces marinus]BDZ55266.1 oxidoreductase [Agromyces marinus]
MNPLTDVTATVATAPAAREAAEDAAPAAAPAAPDAAPDLSLRESFAILADQLDGRLTLPGDAEYDRDRLAWNLAVDQRPAAVVVAASAADVARTVRAARGLGLAVAPQATGHNAGPLAEAHGLADAILLRTHELRAVEVRPTQRLARVEAGALWSDVVAAAAPYELAALAGSSHDVGVVGYTLGGGVSFLGRAHGLAANHVLAVELVTADGEFRRVDATHDPELFWAVRGGGGDFGVVTAIEFGLLELPQVVAGALFFPIERTEEVLQAWADWTRAVPDTVTSVGRVLRFPPLPELPQSLSGQSFVLVEAVVQEAPERADELLEPLRRLAPAMDSIRPQGPAELLELHMDPPGPVPGHGDGMLLKELPAEAVRAFVAAVGPEADTALMSVEIRQLGGAFAPGAAVELATERGLPLPGATAGLEAEYLVYAVAVAAPGTQETVASSLGRLFARVEPWRAGVEYLNFAERAVPGSRFFADEGRLARLRALKHAIDPTGVIRSNHPVGR